MRSADIILEAREKNRSVGSEGILSRRIVAGLESRSTDYSDLGGGCRWRHVILKFCLAGHMLGAEWTCRTNSCC